MKILAVIAARGGSKGVKNKNIKPLAGKPLILYTIEQVLEWGKFDKFVVSTDSEEIRNIAKASGAEAPFTRPKELSGDKIGKLAVLRHALSEAERYYSVRFDAVLDLDATSPIRAVEDIDNIVNMFEQKKADCVFSVVKARKNPYFNMVEEQPDGTVRPCKKAPFDILARQSEPAVYEMNASLYVYGRDFLLDESNKTPYCKRAYAYKMQDKAAVDIDTEANFKYIEFLVKEEMVKL